MLVVNARYEIYRWQVLSLLNCIKRDFLRRANIQGIEPTKKFALPMVILLFLFYKQDRLYICSDNFRYISLIGLVKSISEMQLHTVIQYLLFSSLNT